MIPWWCLVPAFLAGGVLGVLAIRCRWLDLD